MDNQQSILAPAVEVVEIMPCSLDLAEFFEAFECVRETSCSNLPQQWTSISLFDVRLQ